MQIEATSHVPSLGAFATYADRVGIAARRNRYPAGRGRSSSPRRFRIASPRAQLAGSTPATAFNLSHRRGLPGPLRSSSPHPLAAAAAASAPLGRSRSASPFGGSSGALYLRRHFELQQHRNSLGHTPLVLRDPAAHKGGSEGAASASAVASNKKRLTFATLHASDEDNAYLRRLAILRSNQRSAAANIRNPPMTSTSTGGIGGVWGGADPKAAGEAGVLLLSKL